MKKKQYQKTAQKFRPPQPAVPKSGMVLVTSGPGVPRFFLTTR